jgi:probable phosphoglycerate mutase
VAFSSDLLRARRTAELSGFAHPRLTTLLREFDYGEYEGRTTVEIRAGRPGWDLFRDGCPGGESPGQVYGRAQLFVRLLDGLGGPVAVFGHGHFLRALCAAWAGLGIAAANRFALDTGSLSILQDDDHGRVISRWNQAVEDRAAELT